MIQVVLQLLAIDLSDRKIRLGVCWRCRNDYDLDEHQLLAAAVTTGEGFADGVIADSERQRVYEALLQSLANTDWLDNWGASALQCVTQYAPDDPRLPDWHRESFPNPFVPLTWNPEWFTSTVRDLAAHVYESREFHLMPILGDALQDAGCEHQLVQDHCRSTKPHARGCWVVDAILGKT